MMTTAPRERAVLGAMYAGLGLTAATLIVLYVDHATANVLAGHIRAGYPAYTQARIESAVTTYLVYLSGVGALGIASWLAAIWAVRAGKRWARGASTTLFALGTGIALTDLLVRDTSGDTGLPPLLGWAGMLPCAAGLLAVGLLWREIGPAGARRRRTRPFR
jgi:hypothetical protein